MQIRSQCPRCLRREYAAARLLGFWVWIPPGDGCLPRVSVVCRTSIGICDGLITHAEESYRVWCVSECDREASEMRRPWPTGGCCAIGKKNVGTSKFFVMAGGLGEFRFVNCVTRVWVVNWNGRGRKPLWDVLTFCSRIFLVQVRKFCISGRRMMPDFSLLPTSLLRLLLT
jgi:hypothetical protein